MILGLQHFICQHCKTDGRNMMCVQVPPLSSKISVTDSNRPQTLASAVLFRNHVGVNLIVLSTQRAWWPPAAMFGRKATRVISVELGGGGGVWESS
jgi:hypothetical protein